MIPVILGIVVFNFALLHLAPGDAVDVMAGEAGASNAEYVAQLRQQYGLDKPLPVQLGNYLWHVVQLDLGYSYRHNRPVLGLILERLPATLSLMLTALYPVDPAGGRVWACWRRGGCAPRPTR